MLLLVVSVTAASALLVRQLYADQPPVRQAPVLPGDTAVPASQQPGPTNVEGTEDAVEHPLFGTIQDLLQRYFDAINNRNYALWQTTVTQDRIRAQPEQAWQDGYRSTRDGSIVIRRIEAAPTGSGRVTLSFTSAQDVEDAPPDLPVGCIRWHVVYPIELEADEWKIAASTTTAPQTQKQKCAVTS